MEIKILGTGCAKCTQLEKEVRNAVAELNLDANIEKVEDIRQIMSYNVMLTPALVINARVKVSGKVPKREDIKRLIQEEM